MGHLGVWGELVNHKRSLTHRPISQGWAPMQVSCSFCICLVVLYRCGVLVLGFLPFILFLHDYLSYVVCYAHVFSCTCIYMSNIIRTLPILLTYMHIHYINYTCKSHAHTFELHCPITVESCNCHYHVCHLSALFLPLIL